MEIQHLQPFFVKVFACNDACCIERKREEVKEELTEERRTMKEG